MEGVKGNIDVTESVFAFSQQVTCNNKPFWVSCGTGKEIKHRWASLIGMEQCRRPICFTELHRPDRVPRCRHAPHSPDKKGTEVAATLIPPAVTSKNSCYSLREQIFPITSSSLLANNLAPPSRKCL